MIKRIRKEVIRTPGPQARRRREPTVREQGRLELRIRLMRRCYLSLRHEPGHFQRWDSRGDALSERLDLLPVGPKSAWTTPENIDKGFVSHGTIDLESRISWLVYGFGTDS